MAFTMRKHGTYDALTWHLRCVNMVFAMRENNKLCDCSFTHSEAVLRPLQEC